MAVSMLERVRKMRENGAFPSEGGSTPKKPSTPVNTIKPKASSVDMSEALKVFGHTKFREGQEEAIAEVMGGENGVLCVFPTGGGKSLVYQLPSVMSDKLTVVVSPLISLMKDQVDKLQKLGVNAIFINSTVPMSDVRLALAEVSSGGVKALYVAPERFGNVDFNRTMKGLDVDIFTVDEAHCFLGDMMVSTPSGEQRIDSLRVGDEVVSGSEGKPVMGRVSRLFLHRGLDVWKVRINGRDIYCDGGQEFFVKNTGFVSVDKLQCGYEIIIKATDGCVRGLRDSSGNAASEGQAAEQVLLEGMSENRVGEGEKGSDGGQGVSVVLEDISDETGIQDQILFDVVWPAFGDEEGRGIEECFRAIR